jgi:D-alanine-D-alanine ligase
MSITRFYGKKPKVMVLCGGPGTEHLISLQSGYQIYSHIDRSIFEPVIAMIDQDLKWFLLEESNLQNLMLWGRCDFVPLTFDGSDNDFVTEKIDLVYDSLHGSFGEGGCLQSLLDQAKIPYVGSSMESSIITMNKVLTNKLVWDLVQIPYFVVMNDYKELKNSYHSQVQELFGSKVIMKLPLEGSSFGVKLVSNTFEDILEASKDLFAFDKIMIQQYVKGVEITCPVIGKGEHAKALEVIELNYTGEIFDTDAKYTSDKTTELPAKLDPFLIEEIKAKSVQIHNALGCKGITRSDFIYTKDPDTHKDALYFLEINTRPGMSKASITPKSAKAIGWSFSEMITKIIESAL